MTTENFPWDIVTGPLLLSILAVTALTVSDFRRWLPGRYLFKPLSAIAFLWLAIALGAPDSDYNKLLLVGLLLCAAGDILLMFDTEGAFLAGLIAFLSGHLLYAAAFYQLPTNLAGLAYSAIPAAMLVVGTKFWLGPHLAGPMRMAVPGYMLVIAAMLLFAGMTAGQAGAWVIIIGAWGFAFSDLAVARRQFINPTPINGLWGTPLYFFSQMLIAASAAYH